PGRRCRRPPGDRPPSRPSPSPPPFILRAGPILTEETLIGFPAAYERKTPHGAPLPRPPLLLADPRREAPADRAAASVGHAARAAARPPADLLRSHAGGDAALHDPEEGHGARALARAVSGPRAGAGPGARARRAPRAEGGRRQDPRAGRPPLPLPPPAR